MLFHFSPYAAVLLDLDGTIYHENDVLPGAAELIRHLQKIGKPIACLSNSTSSPSQLVRRLKTMGIDLPERAIYTALVAAAEHVLRVFDRPSVFNLATDGLFELLDGRVDWVEIATERCDVVIAGTPSYGCATPDRQQVALELLRRGARLVGVCADRVYPSPRGLELGCGALCAMLSYGAGDVTPTFCGKPEVEFFTSLCDRLGVAAADCILIGDNLDSDIAGAKRVNMQTILVLTGVVRPADVQGIPRERSPDLIVPTLVSLLE